MSGLTAENLEARKGLFSASKSGELMRGGGSREAVKQYLINERLGIDQSFKPTAPMREGIKREEEALAFFNANFAGEAGGGEFIHNTDFITVEFDGVKFGATPDAIGPYDICLEIKCLTPKQYEKQIITPKEEYVWQVHTQRLVMTLRSGLGKPCGYLFLYNPYDKVFPCGKLIKIPKDSGKDRLIESAIIALEGDIRKEMSSFGMITQEEPVGAKLARNRGKVIFIDKVRKKLNAAINDAAGRAIEVIEAEDKALGKEQFLLEYEGKHKSQFPVGVREFKTTAVSIDDIDAVPDEFITKTAKKAEIKKALEAGKTVPGASLVQHSVIGVAAERNVVPEGVGENLLAHASLHADAVELDEEQKLLEVKDA